MRGFAGLFRTKKQHPDFRDLHEVYLDAVVRIDGGIAPTLLRCEEVKVDDDLCGSVSCCLHGTTSRHVEAFLHESEGMVHGDGSRDVVPFVTL
jgi:hypothetical protein